MSLLSKKANKIQIQNVDEFMKGQSFENPGNKNISKCL